MESDQNMSSTKLRLWKSQSWSVIHVSRRFNMTTEVYTSRILLAPLCVVLQFKKMIITVTRSQYRRASCYTFRSNAWREIDLSNVKMSQIRHNFRLINLMSSPCKWKIIRKCVELTRKYATSKWRQNMKLFKLSTMKWEIWMRDTSWKIRSVTFLPYMRTESMKIPLK